MKKYYSYDYNGKLISEGEAELCQVTEQKKLEQSKRSLKEGEAQIESVFILPAFSTEVEPPKPVEGHDIVFNGGEWVYKEIPEPPKPEPIVEREKSYEELRRENYPDVFEYIDGIVKNDQAQIAAYIQKCKDVKAKFPKLKDK